MNILDLLRSDASIVVNKFLAREIGLNETVILSELISRYKWHQSKKEDKGGWFYCTKDTLEEQTSLNRYYQDKAIDNLIEMGLIDKKTTGIPAKRYFHIEEKKVASLVMNKNVKDLQTRKGHSSKQESDIVANKNVTESQEVISTNNNQDNNHNNSCVFPTLSKLKREDGMHRDYPDEFEKVWAAYPKRKGADDKGGGYEKFRARVEEGISVDNLLKGVENYYIEQEREENINTRYVMQMKKFFGAKDIWLEYAEKDMTADTMKGVKYAN